MPLPTGTDQGNPVSVRVSNDSVMVLGPLWPTAFCSVDGPTADRTENLSFPLPL